VAVRRRSAGRTIMGDVKTDALEALREEAGQVELVWPNCGFGARQRAGLASATRRLHVANRVQPEHNLPWDWQDNTRSRSPARRWPAPHTMRSATAHLHSVTPRPWKPASQTDRYVAPPCPMLARDRLKAADECAKICVAVQGLLAGREPRQWDRGRRGGDVDVHGLTALDE